MMSLFEFVAAVDGDFVDDAVDHLKRCYSVNYYSPLSLYSEYFDCWHCDVDPMVLDAGLVFDHNDYVHCQALAMLQSMVYCD